MNESFDPFQLDDDSISDMLSTHSSATSSRLASYVEHNPTSDTVFTQSSTQSSATASVASTSVVHDPMTETDVMLSMPSSTPPVSRPATSMAQNKVKSTKRPAKSQKENCDISKKTKKPKISGKSIRMPLMRY